MIQLAAAVSLLLVTSQAPTTAPSASAAETSTAAESPSAARPDLAAPEVSETITPSAVSPGMRVTAEFVGGAVAGLAGTALGYGLVVVTIPILPSLSVGGAFFRQALVPGAITLLAPIGVLLAASWLEGTPKTPLLGRRINAAYLGALAGGVASMVLGPLFTAIPFWPLSLALIVALPVTGAVVGMEIALGREKTVQPVPFVTNGGGGLAFVGRF